MLKVSETRIKNAKLNISLKFKSETEKEDILNNFLFKIANKQIKIIDDDKQFIFYLDDHYIRMVFENRLKSEEGITLNYEMNHERIKIEKANFINFLFVYSKKEEDYFIKKLEDELKKDELKNKIKKGAKKFTEKIIDVVTSISSEMLIKLIKGTIQW